MALTDKHQPSRSRDELLAQVIARGKILRRRRHTATAAVAGALTVVIGVVVVATMRPGVGSSTVATSNGGGTTTMSTAGTIVVTPAPPASPAPTTTIVPITSPPVTRVTTATTATTRPKPTTTVSGTSGVTVVPTTTTLPTQVCKGSELAITLSFDHPGSPPSYQPGQAVTGTFATRYVGQEPCLAEGGYTYSFEVYKADGQMAGLQGGTIADYGVPAAIFPGVTTNGPFQWNQLEQCNGQSTCQEPPGVYTAVLTFVYDGGTAGTATAPFQLVAAS